MSGKYPIPTRISASALRAVLFTGAAMLAFTQLYAQSTTTYTEYAAKFLCGIPNSAQLANEFLGNAEYTTSINIHNPNLFSSDAPITFQKKAVLAFREGSTPIPPSAFKQDTLTNDYAEYVNCTVIRGLLGAPAAPSFIEGFVVIVVPPAASPNQLDVVGVYTASNNKAAGLQPTSLEIVTIEPRVITPPPGAAAAVDGRFH